jgi:ribosomal protein S18 acetylase RimI-like enzyme
VWAATTAKRDGKPPAPRAGSLVPVIASVVVAPDAILLSAIDAADETVGFAAIQASTVMRAELRYLGVRPDVWGQGIAASLLCELTVVLRVRGFTSAELWVYEHNTAAVSLYQRLGWRALGSTRVHPRTRKTERQYMIDFN